MDSKMGVFISSFVTILMAVLSIWSLKEYFLIFFEKKEKKGIYRFVWTIYFAWQIISIGGLFVLQAHARLVMSLFFTLVVAIGYNCGLIKGIIFASIYNSIWMLMESIVGTVFISIDMHYVSEGVFGSILSKLLLLVLVKALQKFFYNENIRKLPYIYDIPLLIVPVGSMYVVYNLFMMSSKLYKGDHIFSSFISLIIMTGLNILVFIIYLRISEYLELRNSNAIYKQEIELCNKHIEEKTNVMVEWRRVRHDLKNQLLYLLELSINDEREKLNVVLEKMIKKEPFKQLIVINTGNTAVDVLINYKVGIARKYGIDCEVKVLIPSVIPFDDADLCIIIGNALDNAIEANLRANIENPYIKFHMKLDRNNLIIVVENSFDGIIKRGRSGKLITTKKDAANHGIGMSSIQRAIEKYHGFFKENVMDKAFQLKLVLYADEKKLHD